jgi:hypothetical protein
MRELMDFETKLNIEKESIEKIIVKCDAGQEIVRTLILTIYNSWNLLSTFI